MRNALYYNYGISISELYKKEDCYYFEYNNYNYIIVKHQFTYEELESKFYMSQYLYRNGVPVNLIIKTNNQKLQFIYDNVAYILMKKNYDSSLKEISMNDIISFNNSGIWKKENISYAKIWSEKIDYIEYQVSEMAKQYEIIRDSVSYFIGLAENAITLCSEINADICCVSHIKFSSNPEEFYNPLNFMIDIRIRDISEYFKHMINLKKFNLSLFSCGTEVLGINEIILVYSRILFPNYYFDLVEECLIDEKKDYKLKYIIDNIKYIEEQLQQIYSLLNYLPIIEWLNINKLPNK